jgi:hypothetical protein
MSLRRNGIPHPLHRKTECLPLDLTGGSNSRLRVREWGDPVPTKDRHWYAVYSVIWPLLPPPSPVSKLDRRHTGRLRKKDNLLTGERGRSQIIRRGERLVLYNILNTLWLRNCTILYCAVNNLCLDSGQQRLFIRQPSRYMYSTTLNQTRDILWTT